MPQQQTNLLLQKIMKSNQQLHLNDIYTDGQGCQNNFEIKIRNYVCNINHLFEILMEALVMDKNYKNQIVKNQFKKLMNKDIIINRKEQEIQKVSVKQIYRGRLLLLETKIITIKSLNEIYYLQICQDRSINQFIIIIMGCERKRIKEISHMSLINILLKL